MFAMPLQINHPGSLDKLLKSQANFMGFKVKSTANLKNWKTLAYTLFQFAKQIVNKLKAQKMSKKIWNFFWILKVSLLENVYPRSC